MEILRNKLACEDVVRLIFEYLINDTNYRAFTLEDIKIFSDKITNWKTCIAWGVISKGLKWIEYSETKIPEDEKHQAYKLCLRVSAFYGNLTMLKYFEKKGTYSSIDWEQIICQASRSITKISIRHSVREEDSFEIFKYIEQKLGKEGIYLGITMYGCIDLIDYMWNRGYKERWKTHMYNSARFNHLEMLKWIEVKVSPKKIDWRECRLKCFWNASMDTYKYCVTKAGYIFWGLEVRHAVTCGNFKMFKYTVLKYEELKNRKKLNWDELMIDTVCYSSYRKDRYRIFTYCRERAIFPNYDICMKYALKNGLPRIVFFCENKLTDINLEECMSYAVKGGCKFAIKHILQKTKDFDLRPYIKHVVEDQGQLRRFNTMKYLESMTNKPINWEEMIPWRPSNNSDTLTTRYIDSKLQIVS